MGTFLKQTLSLFLLAALLVCTANSSAQSLTVTGLNPSDISITDGKIFIHGCAASKQYSVIYSKNSIATPAANLNSDINGVIVIGGLDGGTYANFSVSTIDNPPVTQIIVTPIILVGGAIATQATKFFAAVYGNFTGVPDDNPSGFVQTYARLSQYLNARNGISKNSNICRRYIFFRNFTAQFMYGGTDKFQTYSKDTLGDKFSNRMDLLGHAYLNAAINLNLLTFIAPENWRNNSGDLAHVYFDIFHSFLGTNVTDTLAANNPATLKTYRVYSSMFGLNLKAAFDLPQWNIEGAAKVFTIHPWSSAINPNLNIQTANVADVYLAKNAKKDFVRASNPIYFQFDVQVQYRTGDVASASAGSQSGAVSNSNVFIKYSYASNFVKSTGNHYPNNYFQLQLGYALDITKLLQGSSSTSTTPVINAAAP